MHVGKLNFINDYNDDDEEEKLNSEPDSDIHVQLVQLNFFNDYKDGNSLGSSKLNFIKFGGKSKSEYNQPIKRKIFMDEIKDNEIFRPKLNFTSNAKPELLKYRDVKIDKKMCMVPCEGIYADIKKLPYDSVFAENNEMFKLRYKIYKSFFEKSKGAFI